MVVPIGKEADEEEYEGVEQPSPGFTQNLVFNEKRHIEKIEAYKTMTQTWRMKERVNESRLKIYMLVRWR